MVGEVIDGRYRLEERIAVGGMAEVWAAEDLDLGRRVALKLLLGAADPERFAREARAAAALSHPAICRVYEYGEADGRPFIVLEYLAGGTLEDRLASGKPLADEETARIAREVASGLAHAHERDLVHRDVKPGNVLFDEQGAAKITDFGIARMLSEPTLTDAGTLLGTAAYISPEQARGERATPASDVYSFGVILYRMLTGRLPFEAESALELAALHEGADPPPISSLRSDAPAALARVATAALAKRPEERPRDGTALLAALQGEPETAATAVLTAPAGAAPPGPRRLPRALLFGAAVAALAVGGAAAALLASNEGSEAPAPVAPRDTTRSTAHSDTRERTRPAQPTQTRAPTTAEQPPPAPAPQPTQPPAAPPPAEPPPVTPTLPSVPEVTTPPETPTTPAPVPTVTETNVLPTP